MKRMLLLALVGCALVPYLFAQVQAAPPVTIQFKHSLFFAEPGVTAAYSLDTDVAEAEAVPGGYRIVGRAPGQTNVVIVGIAGPHTVLVNVPMPHIHGRAGGSSMPGQVMEYGQYQFFYNNNPNQITNMEDVTQVEGTRTIHIRITNANIIAANGEAPVGFPLLSYQIAQPHHSVTFVDEMVDNTDLTMNGILLRGIHATAGPWAFHAGITSVTQFQDFLLPGNRYYAAGLSRRFLLDQHSLLEASFYYFNTGNGQNSGAKSGPIGTIEYRYVGQHGFAASGEVGLSNGIALSGKIEGGTKSQHYHADLHYLPHNIASLGMGVLHGRTANFNWSGKLGKRFETQASGSDTGIDLKTERQQIDTMNLNEVFLLNPHLGLMGGLTASRFASMLPISPTIRSRGFVTGPQVQWKYLGGSFQYQILSNSGHVPDSHDYALTAQTSVAHVSLSAFYNSQTETPVLAPAQSPDTSLREMLQRESVAAITPAEMAKFVRQSSTLTSQGYTQAAAFGLATSRKQYGGALNWASRKVGRVSVNTLINTSTGGNVPGMRLFNTGVTWARRLGPNNMLNTNVSLFRDTSGGQTSTQPVIQFSLQHQLFSVPRWILPSRHGTIQGYVFEDASNKQSYAPGDRPLSGTLVYLDGHRSTHTDAKGHYQFRGVPYGMHRVESDFRGKRTFFYTSSNPKSVVTGDTADFGINFARGRIFGTVVNDAGQGLQISLKVVGNNISREVVTQGNGSFELDGLLDGAYTIQPVAETVPPGYDLSNLHDQGIAITAAHPGHVSFVIPAQRSASGQVLIVDPGKNQRTPVAGVAVFIDSLHRTVHTDSHGRFLFRNLSAGTRIIAVRYNGKLFQQTITLDSGPDIANVTIEIPRPATHPHDSPGKPTSRTPQR